MTQACLISYHYPCPDGVFAALAAHLSFSKDAEQQIIWVPNTVYAPKQLTDLHLEVGTDLHSCTHTNNCLVKVPLPQAGQTLYMLDFAGPPGFAKAAAEFGARYVWCLQSQTLL